MLIKDNIFEISTVPKKKSYIWKDEKPSILAFILLWLMFVCRFFSLLQWGKFLFRKIGKRCRRVSKDPGAKRPNVPVLFVECYFILWLAAQILIYNYAPFDADTHIIISVVCGYYLFESVIWVIYYTVLRRFFEEKYSINHILEYFVVLLVLVPAQALAFSNINGFPFSDCLLGVLGISEIEGQILMSIIGLGFQIIVIAMIVNSFPPELIHVQTTTFTNMIIGCGDVVKNRLRPELMRRQAIISYVFATEKDKDSEEYCMVASEERIKKKIKHFSDDETIVWIETPSNKHIDYLKFMLDENVRCRLMVLEKPIAVSLNELELIDKHIQNSYYDDHIFFLSYYILEKALPLYMYYKYNRAYNKYLDIYTELSTDDVEKDGEEVFKNFPKKTDLKKITVTLHEKEPEKRKWVDEVGGQACETFIHNMLIASLFVGIPDNWKIREYDKTKNHLEAILLKDSDENLKLNNDVEIVLDMQKGVETCRYAKLEFSDGQKLFCDFDEKALYICIKDCQNNCEKGCKRENGQLAIKVKRAYDYKYAILTDLVARVTNDECECEDVDGRINQIECLKWLIRQKKDN